MLLLTTGTILNTIYNIVCLHCFGLFILDKEHSAIDTHNVLCEE